MENNNNELTMEQIGQEIDDFVKGTSIDNVCNFPSNNGVETTPENVKEDGEMRRMNVSVDPNTGEHKIIGEAGIEDNETFEEMCERINSQEIKMDSTPVTESELVDYISTNSDTVLKEISKGTDLSSNSIRTLLGMVNRRLNKEEFNVYKEFPDQVKNMINDYIGSNGMAVNSTEGKTFRNLISEQLLEEFISNISIDRTMNDFNKEVETLFEKGTKEISDNIIGYTEERNKNYREFAEKIEDEEKKEKILSVLDKIDEASNITELKEFSKKCKIKRYDLEKPEKIYDDFLFKYSKSTYNIYDIKMAAPILYRNLNLSSEETYTDKDVHAFLICFCKQAMNMHPENVYEHAYMYYFIYNLVLLDVNKGGKREISEKFLDNIKECIANIRERNNNFK